MTLLHYMGIPVDVRSLVGPHIRFVYRNILMCIVRTLHFCTKFISRTKKKRAATYVCYKMILFYLYVRYFTGAIKRLNRVKMTTSYALYEQYYLFKSRKLLCRAKFKDEIYE